MTQTGGDETVPAVAKGRLVIAGSSDWDAIGRSAKDSKKTPGEVTSFPGFVVYTPAGGLEFVSVHTSCSSCHSICIDDAGRALAFGRNDKGQLGTGNTKSSTIPCVVKLPASVTGVVHAATGRSHSLVVTSDGKVFAAGENKNGQLGTGAGKEVTTWTLVPGLTDQKIVKVAAGVDFSLALSKDGQLWGWGSPQYGQLGNGSDEQHIAKANKIVYEPQTPKPIAALKETKIVDMQCGFNHTLAVDAEGAIYTWGCAGYGRLGHNDVPPRDVMIPKEVPGFKNRNNFVKKIAAGPTCCMVTDSRDGLYVWGKWKNSGDGGQGTPWMYPRYFDGLSGWKIEDIACGGVSLFALSEKSTISWGQNAQNGELGHGAGKPKSATNAVKVNALDGAHVFSVSCGVGHTLALVDIADPVLKTLEKMPGEPVDFSAAQSTSPTKKRKADAATDGAGKKAAKK